MYKLILTYRETYFILLFLEVFLNKFIQIDA